MDMIALQNRLSAMAGDPFTYTVHALRNLTVKSTGIEGIYMDVLILLGFSVIMISGSIALFKRQL